MMLGDLVISEDLREEYEREFITCLVLNDEAIKYVRVKPFYLKTEQLKEIFEDENFSVIESNKGSTHFLLSLQFIFKKIFNKTDSK